ncbi:nmra family transcriptional regulator [Rhodococcus sp. WWJCD1]|uniref:SDR family oxidoreductase n=1 Tax=Rhodococcus sp. WWJCD1 TaxID=2022519 RepID=UPI000B9A4407|nr:NmrA family NAD(P)-binding protein [Rhodococcus sp. WWJCD1]OZC45510.1 nmra family transcriptional regulator [Rhodococcus sp. WWJCD1]
MELDASRGTDIAIVGATGKTGRAVAAALDGVAVVRRLSRSAPDYAVDLETGEGLVEALTGCRGVYFIAPNVHPDEPALLLRALEAAAAAGVDHVVYHSVAWPYSPRMPHHMDKARCEEELRAFGSERGLHWTILQPCAYAQNFEAVLTGSSSLVVPYSLDTKFSFVSLEDVAEVATRILVEGGDIHHGATYELGGPEILSVRDVVRLVETMTGRAVSINSVGVDEWMSVHEPELSPDAQQRLSAMFEYYNDRDFLASCTVTATLLGRSPTPIRALVL